jgi:beta-phosphoglucomutase-like phosphatase (HAD superfamily)
VARHFLGRSYPVVMAQIHTEFGLDLPPAFEGQYRDRPLRAFEERLKTMPCIVPRLDGLALRCCVATSSGPRRLTGLRDRQGPVTFTASEVQRGQPAPDLFLHVASRMEADLARRADEFFVGVGKMSNDAPLLTDGFVTREELRDM